MNCLARKCFASRKIHICFLCAVTLAAIALVFLRGTSTTSAASTEPQTVASPSAAAAKSLLPTHAELAAALREARQQKNGGFGLDMWATIVDRDGIVHAVAFTGADRGAQWPGSRVISAQKANTANAFSLPGLALSTANLYSAVQPGGSLFGLQHSNPVDASVAYGGNPHAFGQANDPMGNRAIGGVNVFGGGLPLYNQQKVLVGAIGVSGDTSCADHNIAWRTRHLLRLDYVPAGVSGDAERPDNIVFDIAPDANAHVRSVGGFGHPHAIGGNEENERTLAATLPPIRK